MMRFRKEERAENDCSPEFSLNIFGLSLFSPSLCLSLPFGWLCATSTCLQDRFAAHTVINAQERLTGGLGRTCVQEVSPFRTEEMIFARLLRLDCSIVSPLGVAARCAALCAKLSGGSCLASVLIAAGVDRMGNPKKWQLTLDGPKPEKQN